MPSSTAIFCLLLLTKLTPIPVIGFRLKFNNASQRIFGGTVRPIVLVWETNDAEIPWRAEARRECHCYSASIYSTKYPIAVIDNNGHNVLPAVCQASAARKREAKELAAQSGFEYLCSLYPSLHRGDN
jgi:hypothetical protein